MTEVKLARKVSFRGKLQPSKLSQESGLELTGLIFLVLGEAAVIKVDRPDSGVYFCSVSSSRQRREESRDSPPVLTSPASSVSAREGSSASLSCVVSGPRL